MKTIRWGMIGCGDGAELKGTSGFYQAGNSTLIAATRRNGPLAEDYAQRHRVLRWHDDADAIITAPDIDAVYVATLTDSHRDYTLRCARAGKPVYVETPMAMNHDECADMLVACHAANVPLWVAYYRRALPRFLKIKELLDAGAIGAVRTVVSRQLRRLSDTQMLSGRTPTLRIDRAAGGGSFEAACQTFDFLDFLFGPIVAVNGFAANQAAAYKPEDTLTTSFRFESGVHGCGTWCYAADHDEDMNEIIGGAGSILFSTSQAVPIRLVRGDSVEEFLVRDPPEVHQPLIQTIVAELNGRGHCPSTGQAAARTAWVIDEILGELRSATNLLDEALPPSTREPFQRRSGEMATEGGWQRAARSTDAYLFVTEKRPPAKEKDSVKCALCGQVSEPAVGFCAQCGAALSPESADRGGALAPAPGSASLRLSGGRSLMTTPVRVAGSMAAVHAGATATAIATVPLPAGARATALPPPRWRLYVALLAPMVVLIVAGYFGVMLFVPGESTAPIAATETLSGTPPGAGPVALSVPTTVAQSSPERVQGDAPRQQSTAVVSAAGDRQAEPAKRPKTTPAASKAVSAETAGVSRSTTVRAGPLSRSSSAKRSSEAVRALSRPSVAHADRSKVAARPPHGAVTRPASPVPQLSEPLPASSVTADEMPAARRFQSPQRDRWQMMNDALAQCTNRAFLARAVCDQRVRLQYCDGYWGRVAQCSRGINNDNKP